MLAEHLRRMTKIVCTLGPATDDPEILRGIFAIGCDVLRFNFSHGTHNEHARRVHLVRSISENIALLLDTKGPEIRTGQLKEKPVRLEEGARLSLLAEDVLGDASRISLSYADLWQHVVTGTRILLDDGLIGLRVEEVRPGEILARVENGGLLGERKSVNVPGVRLPLPSLTERDEADLRFAIAHDFDFIAASFVRRAEDVYAIRRVLEAEGREIPIIAKIENEEGVENAEEILAVSDGLMVARGDLGVEIPVEDVPFIQKRLIVMGHRAGKPVITATQMLNSMIENPRPTRAEASDIANAILDGTDAVMLSGETAVGRYPVQAVRTMAQIALRTEEHFGDELYQRARGLDAEVTHTAVLSRAVAEVAESLGARAVLTPTESGYTARNIARCRPHRPIVAVTPNPRVARKLRLVWGVFPFVADSGETIEAVLEQTIGVALEHGLISRGDLVVLTAGIPVREAGNTNLLKVHVVGDVVGRGLGIGEGVVTARAFVRRPGEDLHPSEEPYIYVTSRVSEEDIPYLRNARAVVAEEGGMTSQAAVAALSLGIPAVVGVERITEKVQTGMDLTVDVQGGRIYAGYAKVL